MIARFYSIEMESGVEPAAAKVGDPSRICIFREQCYLLHSALDRLAPDAREIVLVYAGVHPTIPSMMELSRRHGIPVSTLRSRCRKVIGTVRTLLPKGVQP